MRHSIHMFSVMVTKFTQGWEELLRTFTAQKENERVKVHVSDHVHDTLTLLAWSQRSDTFYCPKHHLYQDNMILYSTAPMVGFWDQDHCSSRFRLFPAICFVSFPTHQLPDNPRKISPDMDKDERNNHININQSKENPACYHLYIHI